MDKRRWQRRQATQGDTAPLRHWEDTSMCSRKKALLTICTDTLECCYSHIPPWIPLEHTHKYTGESEAEGPSAGYIRMNEWIVNEWVIIQGVKGFALGPKRHMIILPSMEFTPETYPAEPHSTWSISVTPWCLRLWCGGPGWAAWKCHICSASLYWEQCGQHVLGSPVSWLPVWSILRSEPREGLQRAFL